MKVKKRIEKGGWIAKLKKNKLKKLKGAWRWPRQVATKRAATVLVAEQKKEEQGKQKRKLFKHFVT